MSLTASIFPSKDLVLAACRGFPVIGNHPVLDAASELALLHQIRECTPVSELEEIDWRRTRLVLSIDRWVRIAAPVPFEAARTHTETIGQVIDRLAQLTMQAFLALANAPDWVYYDAYVIVLDLANAYQDLVDEVAVGIRRLPQRSAYR
ncbi:DUF4254 domain-containing protein [Nocardia sp. GP40]|uniref:DUF4254 domain-containing protein n=1 Tax=Nocardia sp. GP40 TaxID=3156268 RepID=UPI003D245DB1